LGSAAQDRDLDMRPLAAEQSSDCIPQLVLDSTHENPKVFRSAFLPQYVFGIIGSACPTIDTRPRLRILFCSPPLMMVINRRPRIIGAAQAGPERGGNGIDVLAREARPRTKILVETPDPLMMLKIGDVVRNKVGGCIGTIDRVNLGAGMRDLVLVRFHGDEVPSGDGQCVPRTQLEKIDHAED
jgi:hypothetical protein